MKDKFVIVSLFLIGCEPSTHITKKIVECNSGFRTPPSSYAMIDHGIIEWQLNFGGPISYKRIEAGDVCTRRNIHVRRVSND